MPEQLARGALAGAWTLDPARSTVALTSKSMWGLLPIRGVFREVEGAGTVTADGQVTGHLAVKTASLDTKIGKRDEHLRSSDFFASDTYPTITFALAGIEPAATGMTVAGTLTVRDQSRPLSFPATATLASDGEVCLNATVHVDRAEFGLTYNKMNMTSTHNTVTINAVFTRD
jgi:polyisoprenoid-binding protein YceI